MEKAKQQHLIAGASERVKLFKEARRDEHSEKCIVRAFEYLDTMIPTERRISERPSIDFCDLRHGELGGSMIGSENIDISTACRKWDMASVVAHESFHFFQDKDGFTQRAVDFDYKCGIYNRAIAVAFMESGAYFFESAFSNGSKKNRMVRSLAGGLKYDARENCTTYGEVILKVCCAMRSGLPELLLATGWPRSGINTRIIKNSQSSSGRAMALLVFAATDYDVNGTLDALVSNPAKIMDMIKMMGDDKFLAFADRTGATW